MHLLLLRNVCGAFEVFHTAPRLISKAKTPRPNSHTLLAQYVLCDFDENCRMSACLPTSCFSKLRTLLGTFYRKEQNLEELAARIVQEGRTALQNMPPPKPLSFLVDNHCLQYNIDETAWPTYLTSVDANLHNSVSEALRNYSGLLPKVETINAYVGWRLPPKISSGSAQRVPELVLTFETTPTDQAGVHLISFGHAPLANKPPSIQVDGSSVPDAEMQAFNQMVDGAQTPAPSDYSSHSRLSDDESQA